MTNEQFDALVSLIQSLAYRAAGDATNQTRAGDENEDIEIARRAIVDGE